MKILRHYKELLLSVIIPKSERYVEFVIGVTLLVQGLYEFWPGTQLPPETFQYIPQSVGEVVFAAFQIGAALLLLAGTMLPPGRYSKFARRFGSFGTFLAFAFITLLGYISEGVNNLYWIATLGITVLCGIIYIRIGWEKDE